MKQSRITRMLSWMLTVMMLLTLLPPQLLQAQESISINKGEQLYAVHAWFDRENGELRPDTRTDEMEGEVVDWGTTQWCNVKGGHECVFRIDKENQYYKGGFTVKKAIITGEGEEETVLPGEVVDASSYRIELCTEWSDEAQSEVVLKDGFYRITFYQSGVYLVYADGVEGGVLFHVEVPDCGFATSPVLTEESYVADYTYTDQTKSLYLIVPEKEKETFWNKEEERDEETEITNRPDVLRTWINDAVGDGDIYRFDTKELNEEYLKSVTEVTKDIKTGTKVYLVTFAEEFDQDHWVYARIERVGTKTGWKWNEPGVNLRPERNGLVLTTDINTEEQRNEHGELESIKAELRENPNYEKKCYYELDRGGAVYVGAAWYDEENDTCEPLAKGTKVTLINQKTKKSGTYETDKDGIFAFDKLEDAGTYLAEVQMEGSPSSAKLVIDLPRIAFYSEKKRSYQTLMFNDELSMEASKTYYCIYDTDVEENKKIQFPEKSAEGTYYAEMETTDWGKKPYGIFRWVGDNVSAPITKEIADIGDAQKLADGSICHTVTVKKGQASDFYLGAALGVIDNWNPSKPEYYTWERGIDLRISRDGLVLRETDRRGDDYEISNEEARKVLHGWAGRERYFALGFQKDLEITDIKDKSTITMTGPDGKAVELTQYRDAIFKCIFLQTGTYTLTYTKGDVESHAQFDVTNSREGIYCKKGTGDDIYEDYQVVTDQFHANDRNHVLYVIYEKDKDYHGAFPTEADKWYQEKDVEQVNWDNGEKGIFHATYGIFRDTWDKVTEEGGSEKFDYEAAGITISDQSNDRFGVIALDLSKMKGTHTIDFGILCHNEWTDWNDEEEKEEKRYDDWVERFRVTVDGNASVKSPETLAEEAAAKAAAEAKAKAEAAAKVGGELSAPAVNAKIVVTKTAPNATAAYAGPISDTGKVTVPDSVTVNGVTYTITKIADEAFKGNTKLTSVTIGKNVTEIGKNAFAGCSNLKKLNLSGTSIKTIGAGAFSGCKKLKTITINANVTKKVGKNALKGIAKKATITVFAKNEGAYKKFVKKLKSAGAKNAKFKFKKKK